MEYQVRSKMFGNKEDFKVIANSLNRALEVAQIQLDHNSEAKDRTGSLRGDGEVIMWKDGERFGYVSVWQRRNENSPFEKIGG
jgi:hypothetical protein